ncbi:hypothetical protein [Flavobacterium sp. MK4S-17]|uniref:hypothetical protein n=1 Tax=Flavobacterium sp. MK4S-17 TaxID=2543737 RepID=UPI00135BA7CD|nr:hypothetical protein [Flavobacterium sp. MK4S-17]
MSANTPNDVKDQEIDLSQISKKAGQAYNGFLNWLYRVLVFIKKNIAALIILFVLGAGLGLLLDKKIKVYDHEVMVIPNFGITEYVYSKVNLLNSKLKENDDEFFKAIGIKDSTLLVEIEIEPVNDIYGFISGDEQNFELIKLMAEDGDINKIIEDEVTSINYTMHKIKITTSKAARRDKFIDPILKYINQSEYYTKIKEASIQNVKNKIVNSTKMITQIDSLISKYSKSMAQNKNAVVNINESTEINDIITTKQLLLQTVAESKIGLINIDSLVKESSVVLNIKNTKGINGKLKFILPILFILLYFMVVFLIKFYKREKLKETEQQ